MKRIGLAVLILGFALSGCAQKKGKQAQEESRLDRLESGFTRFQEEQRGRDADIDNKLNRIAIRLDQLTAGKPPTPRKGKAAGKTAAAAPSRVAYGQIVPYTALAGTSPQGRQPAPTAGPAPAAPQAAPVALGQPRAAMPLAAGPGPVPAAPPASSLSPGYAPAPPVVTLGDTFKNVPPAAQAKTRQPAPVTHSSRARHGAAAPATMPQPLVPQPEQTPAPASPEVPSLEPAIPQPPQPKAQAKPVTPVAPQAKPATPLAPAQPPAPPAPGSASLDEQRLYTEALRSVSSNRNEEGRKKFNEFLAKYPSSVKTPEALYWIGESYMGDKSYNQAILSFKEVANRFPKDPKAAEALYRTAEAYERLGDKANAAFTLKILTDEHAGSEYAGKARQKLKQLGQ